MTARTLGGVARTSLSERTRHDFAGCDVGLPVPAIFTGGGNRQRRRIHGAVGPVRWNWMGYARNFAAWPAADAAVTSNDLANPFDPGTFADKIELAAVVNARIFKDAYGASIVNGDIVTVFFDTYAASPTDFNLSANAGPSYGQWLPEVTVSVPAGWKRHKLTFPAVSGLTTDTFVRLYLVTRDAVARTFWLDRLHLKVNNDAVEPFIDTPGGVEVSTTDWPRRTLNGNGTTPQYGDGGWWATDGTADLQPSKVIGPSGYPMSKLARRNTNGDGIYAYQSGLTFIAGEKYARRIVSQADDEVGDTVFVELAASPGVYIANGTINVRTGAVPAVNNGTIVLMGQIGRQFIFEMRGTAPATVTTGYCSWIIPNGGTAGQGHYFGCDQVEHSEVCTAHMHSGLGEYGSAITPPFGQLVDVDAGKPRIEYGADGFGRGIKIATEATNNVGNSTNFLAWTPYSGGVGTYKELWDPVWGKFIRITKTGDTGEARCGLLIGITALSGDGCSAGIKMRRITAGASGYAPYVDAYGASGLSTANRYFSDANTPLGEWVDYAVSSGPGNALTGAATFYVWVESAIGSIVDFCFPQCNGGQKLLEYVPTYGDETVAPAEALKFHNMDTFGLNQDAWTIIVEATEPAPDATPGYPMILRMTGPGGVVATINKQPDGQIEFQIYDGSTNVAAKLPAGTLGSTRRYLLGFDRASQTMRYGATGAAVADATGASLATVGPYTDVQIGSADGFWWCNNITAKVDVVKRLLLKEECAKELAL